MTDACASANASKSPATQISSGVANQAILILEVAVRMYIWVFALAITLFLGVRWGILADVTAPPGPAFGWGWRFSKSVGTLILLYNVIYLVELAALRLFIPQPRPGRYDLAARPGKDLLRACGLAILTKARYQA